MIINHNLPGANAIRNMNANSATASKSMQKLSSGLRINGAADDAAGLAISEKMRGQIRGLDQASSNAQDGISMTQTAEGALNETTSILQRMRELSVQAGNDTATDSDRKAMQNETTQLKTEIDRISTTTEFNTKKLLNGSLSAATTAQGTKAASSQFNAADVAATAGTSKAGLAAVVSSVTAGKTGTGASTTAGDALAEKTLIQTGVNDTFNISINGHDYRATLAQSTTEGFTRQQLVEATNSAIKNAVGTDKWTNPANQAMASLTSDNHMMITTATTGSSTLISTSVSDATSGKGATEAMGFDNKQSSIVGSVDLKDGITIATADSKFNINLGNKTTTEVDLIADGGLVNGTKYDFTKLKEGIQKAVDKKLGAGTVTVGDDGLGHLKLTSNVSTGLFATAAATTTGDDGNLQLFGSATATAADDTHAKNVTTKGTNTVNATAAGTYISAGANDEFNISVDGGAAETITLKAGNYATQKDLVTEVNNELNNNANLVGKVTAQLDASGKVSFVSNSTGSSSNVSVTAPTATKESALGALGYEGYASQITGAADLKSGIELNTPDATKLTVTLGNKTANIDLAGATGIESKFGATTGAKTVGTVANATLGAGTTGNFVIKIDGTTITTAVTATDTAAQVATKVNAQANSVLGTTDEKYASIDENGKFNINSLTSGSKSQTGVVSGIGSTVTDLGLTVETTGAAVTGSGAAGAITTGGTLNLKIDGKAIAVSFIDGETAANALIKINAAANTALGTTGKTYAAGGTISINSLTTGTSSQVEVVGTSDSSSTANSILGDLKLATGAGAAGTGTAAGTDSTIGATAGTLTGTATPGVAGATVGNFVFSVDGGANKTAAIAQYDTLDTVVGKINAAAGANIASNDGGKLKLTSATTGTTSSIKVDSTSVGATLTYLGLTSGETNSGSATSGASSRDAIVTALQSKLDDAFGKGAVTVGTSTTSTGVDTLMVNSNTRGAEFSVADGAGKDALFGTTISGAKSDGDAVTANVSAAGTNVTAAGANAIDNTLANSTLVTDLADKDGNNLGVKAGNVINISGTQNGDAFSSSITVTDTTTLSDIENSLRNLSAFSGATVSLDATTGKLSVSGANGSTKDISNLKFTAQNSATDSTAVGGFDKQFAAFTVTQKAADTKSDSSITTQIGANEGQTMNIDINDMGTKALKVADVDLSTQKGAETATTVIDNAIQTVSAERSKLGAFQNRLEHTINNLGTSSENLTSAESRIRDVDMAKEMSTFSKNNILSQAAQAMLAQANQQPQQVLQLLR